MGKKNSNTIQSCSSITKSFKHVDIFSLGFRRKKMQFFKKLFQLTVPLFLDLVLCSILKRLELPGVIFRLHFASREVQRDRFTIHSGRPHSRKSVGTGRKIRKKCNFFLKGSLSFLCDKLLCFLRYDYWARRTYIMAPQKKYFEDINS